MKQSVVYIGVDVAKANLDVAWAAASRRFPNDRNGHTALVVWIKQSAAPVQLICEASGGYEQALLESLEQNNLAVTLGAGHSGAAVCAGGRHPRQDRHDRCKGPGRFWRSDATEANPTILCRAKALASIRSTAPALGQSLARRTKSPGTSELCRVAIFKPQSD